MSKRQSQKVNDLEKKLFAQETEYERELNEKDIELR